MKRLGSVTSVWVGWRVAKESLFVLVYQIGMLI